MNIDLKNRFIQCVDKKNIKKAELFYQEVEKVHLSISGGDIERFQSSKESGYSVRVIKNNRHGFSYANNIEKMEDILDKAINSAEVLSEDNNWTFVENVICKDENFYRDEPSIREKIDTLKEVEKQIYAKDKRIKSIREVTYEFYKVRVNILNSLGSELEYNYQYQYVYTEVGASDGKDERGSWEFKVGKTWYDLDFNDLISKSVWKAISLLGAKPISSQRAVVILPRERAQDLLEVFVQAFSADMVQKGKSIFKNKIGEKIASEKLTIIEDPNLEEAFLRRKFDDEGIFTKSKEIVKDGKLNSFLHNLYTANKDNVKSTGNCVRGSYKNLPGVGAFNLFIKPGEKSEEEIIKSTKDGLYVFNLMGLHLIDPISGDFSIGADGLWIKDGEFVGPVCEITISGNLKDFLQSVSEVSKEITFNGTVVSPMLKLEDIMLAGK
ncbi:MAG: PmbA protein [Dictyoglomus sp. NZ13-RE01]|nr:MAG: PmbA protein [Dictyoglomus sp. NZ13-RE01]